MRWLMTACALGGLGALMRSWDMAAAGWVGGAGAVILLIGFFRWLNDKVGASDRGSRVGDGYIDTTYGGLGDGGGGSCGDGGGGCDGGGGD